LKQPIPLRVRDVMERNVISISPDTTLEEFERLLVKHHVSGMPVMAHGRLLGVATRSDIIRQLLVAQGLAYGMLHYYRDHTGIGGEPEDSPRMALSEAAIVGGRLADLKVRDVMTDNVVTISPSQSVKDAAAEMVHRGIHRLLVVDGGELVGLVTSLDVVGLLLDDDTRDSRTSFNPHEHGESR
jgi:CBS domain-containing protein